MFKNFRKMVRHVFTEDKDGSGNEIGSSKSVYAKNDEQNTKGKTGLKVSISKSALNKQYTIPINTDASVDYIIREEADRGKNRETKFLVKLSVKPIILSLTEIEERFPALFERYNPKKERETLTVDDEDWDRNSDDEVQIVSSAENEMSRNSSRKRAEVKKHGPGRRPSDHIGGKNTKHYVEENNDPTTVFTISDNEEDDVEYKVERIMEMREVDGNRQFRVKWTSQNETISNASRGDPRILYGFDRRYSTWEPEENLKHLEIFKKYIEKVEKEGSEGLEKSVDNGRKAQKEERTETPRSIRRSETKVGCGKSPAKEANDNSAKVKTNKKAIQKGNQVDKNEAETDNESSEYDEDEPEYEVERVIARQNVAKKGGELDWNYRVKWKGYDEITWEPSENVKHLEIVKEFNKRENAKDAASHDKDGAEEDGLGLGPSSSSNAEQKEKKSSLKRTVSALGQEGSAKRGRGRPPKK